MTRFIISHRLSGQTKEQVAKGASALESVAFSASRALNKEVAPVSRTAQSRRRIHLDAEPRDIENLRGQWPDEVIVEEEILRHTAELKTSPLKNESSKVREAAAAGTGVGRKLGVTALGAGAPLEKASASLVFASTTAGGESQVIEHELDAKGQTKYVFSPINWAPSLLLIQPAQGFWGSWNLGPVDGASYNLQALPKTGPLGWWHWLEGLQSPDPKRGAKIKIGVVDTGVGPHPYLSNVTQVGSIINGKFDSAAGAANDARQHGTHVCGIIGAQPVDGSGDYCGIAPGAQIFVVRVFGATDGANQGDIADAIEMLATDCGVDLINLSLGSDQFSQIENDAIQYAAQQGTLCIAASGNASAQSLFYPAAYPGVMAVTACGILGGCPDGTISAQTVPATADKLLGGFYVAKFSNTGPGVACIAPGVGIISTVPGTAAAPAPYAEMSGTSMASPMACAALATILSKDVAYTSMARGLQRTQRAAAVLMSVLTPLPLNPAYVGGGLSRALQ